MRARWHAQAYTGKHEGAIVGLCAGAKAQAYLTGQAIMCTCARMLVRPSIHSRPQCIAASLQALWDLNALQQTFRHCGEPGETHHPRPPATCHLPHTPDHVTLCCAWGH
eukprot:1159224-Pelagomonas_calceolata.AAC.3